MQQLLIHRLNVVFLGEERFKEFEQILFGADVLVQPYFFNDLAQLEGFLRPANYAKKISLKMCTYHLARASSLGLSLSSSKSAL